jgi:hypothetical protein
MGGLWTVMPLGGTTGATLHKHSDWRALIVRRPDWVPERTRALQQTTFFSITGAQADDIGHIDVARLDGFEGWGRTLTWSAATVDGKGPPELMAERSVLLALRVSDHEVPHG